MSSKGRAEGLAFLPMPSLIVTPLSSVVFFLGSVGHSVRFVAQGKARHSDEKTHHATAQPQNTVAWALGGWLQALLIF